MLKICSTLLLAEVIRAIDSFASRNSESVSVSGAGTFLALASSSSNKTQQLVCLSKLREDKRRRPLL